jgi:hypothetical protein
MKMPPQNPSVPSLIEDWSVVNEAVRRKAGLPAIPPKPPRDPAAIINAEARKRIALGWSAIILAVGVAFLLSALAFKWTPAITTRDITFPSLRLHPDDIAKLVEMRVPVTPPPPPGQTGDASVVTNYVVFQNVAFASGVVVTGWRYATNTDSTPAAQYCYFEMRSQVGVAQVSFLENADRRRLPWPGADGALGLTRAEWEDAHSRCKWFRPPR